MPLRPRLTCTTGVRVGAGVGNGVGDGVVGAGVGGVDGSGDGDSVVGAGKGIAVGADVGRPVGAAAHIAPTHHPELQSSATAHAAPMPQAGQYEPPQSTSVSPCAVSSAPFVHPAAVGAG